MLDFTKTTLDALVIHRVGNRIRKEGVVTSNETFLISDVQKPILLNYFLRPFSEGEVWNFAHSSEIQLNEAFSFSRSIFQKRSGFLQQTTKLLKHLYEVSDHPKIKAGEVLFALFSDVQLGDDTVDAIGIFKSEHKDSFLKFTSSESSLQLFIEEGANLKSLDKGCLILNVHAEDGYRVFSVDTNTVDTRYWQEKFLNLAPTKDDQYHTKSYLGMVHDFCSSLKTDEPKKDQILLLKNSMDYFSSHDDFEHEDFAKKVIKDKGIARQFDTFKKTFEKKSGLQSLDTFSISKPALKKAKRQFKDVIRLDTKIEVKLKFSDTDDAASNIERGFDRQKKMFFYKLYFNKEI